MNQIGDQIKDQAGLYAQQARERWQEMRLNIETRSGLDVWQSLKFVLVSGGILYVTLWAYTWWVRADERAKFRAEIAAASPRVRGAMLAGAADAETQDRIALDAIRGTDNALTNSEADLRHAATSTPLDGCPRVPARCLAPAAGGGGVR